jgi:hypothetical protein
MSCIENICENPFCNYYSFGNCRVQFCPLCGSKVASVSDEPEVEPEDETAEDELDVEEKDEDRELQF